jgi:phenylpropionate dioxygenase-like ring-hydroxylating dioxygenase large terminal subunit
LDKLDDPKSLAPGEPLAQPTVYGVEAYNSVAYLEAERDRLWRKVWLEAGRVEEIPNVGDYLTYDVLDDSVLIVRTAPDRIQAYHNVCQHRGRRLVDAPDGAPRSGGRARQFACGFHGWRWSLGGENIHVPERGDWQGCLAAENTRLAPVNVDTWGGWLWINMDPDCEPLRDYLEPAASRLDPFRLEDMRLSWRKWGVFDCNWKVALEAFLESYHVHPTHPEFVEFGDYNGWAKLAGKHVVLGYDAPKDLEQQSTRLRLGMRGDPRITTAKLVTYVSQNVNSNFTQSFVDAALRLADELPEGAPPDQVMKHWVESARRDDAARGVIWPTVDPEQTREAGKSWLIFPNLRPGHGLNNALCYQARPYGYDPDKCVFEVYTLELFPKGEAPATQWVHTPPEDRAGWGPVLPQDFSNMAAVQRGMKSLGFRGPRTNPKEERAVTALHYMLAQYLGTEPPRPLV